MYFRNTMPTIKELIGKAQKSKSSGKPDKSPPKKPHRAKLVKHESKIKSVKDSKPHHAKTAKRGSNGQFIKDPELDYECPPDCEECKLCEDLECAHIFHQCQEDCKELFDKDIEVGHEHSNNCKDDAECIERKVCTGCKVNKQICQFGWQNESKGVRRYQCLQCCQEKCNQPIPNKIYVYDETKICNGCQKELPIGEFWLKNSITGRRETKCRGCRKQQRPQEVKKKQNKRYHYENGGKEKAVVYRKENRESINNSINNNKKKNPCAKIISNMRTRIYQFIKGDNNIDGTVSKSKIIDMTRDDYKKWLERDFTDDMNWDNYGIKWVVDHVIPCKEFDLTDTKQLKACFSWMNCRACYVKENLEKGSKILPDVIARQKVNLLNFLNNEYEGEIKQRWMDYANSYGHKYI
jgi:hypothetical protein